MPLNEESIRYLEEHIPDLAEIAIKEAYWRALASGYSVLERYNNDLVEVFPDGTRKFIKNLPPYTKVTIGQKIIINHE